MFFVFLKAQRPDDYRTFHNNRPLLELNLEFAKWLSHAPESSDTFKDAERFDFLFEREFNTKKNIFFVENYLECLIPKHV
jgi:hypothetical protein